MQICQLSLAVVEYRTYKLLLGLPDCLYGETRDANAASLCVWPAAAALTVCELC